MRLPAVILCAILSVGLSGCVAYYTFVNVTRMDTPPHTGFPKRWDNVWRASVLTYEEVMQTTEVVGQVAHQFGFTGSSDTIWFQQHCTGACDGLNIGFYKVWRDSRKGDEEHGVVNISILLYQTTGRVLIFIIDRDSFSFGPESYTTRLAESIKVALSDRFPASRIETAGHWYWPAIPP